MSLVNSLFSSKISDAKPIIFLAFHGLDVRESCLNTLQSYEYHIQALSGVTKQVSWVNFCVYHNNYK